VVIVELGVVRVTMVRSLVLVAQIFNEGRYFEVAIALMRRFGMAIWRGI
jgi:hypothetical protein